MSQFPFPFPISHPPLLTSPTTQQALSSGILPILSSDLVESQLDWGYVSTMRASNSNALRILSNDLIKTKSAQKKEMKIVDTKAQVNASIVSRIRGTGAREVTVGNDCMPFSSELHLTTGGEERNRKHVGSLISDECCPKKCAFNMNGYEPKYKGKQMKDKDALIRSLGGHDNAKVTTDEALKISYSSTLTMRKEMSGKAVLRGRRQQKVCSKGGSNTKALFHFKTDMNEMNAQNARILKGQEYRVSSMIELVGQSIQSYAQESTAHMETNQPIG